MLPAGVLLVAVSAIGALRFGLQLRHAVSSTARVRQASPPDRPPHTRADTTAIAVGAPANWSEDHTDATPSHYYVWCNDSPRSDQPRDENGIVLCEYRHLSRPVYNATSIAQNAMHSWETWLHAGSETALDEFLRHARWLRDGMDERGRYVYGWPMPERSLEPPWYSAMAQGLAISVLTRAWAHTLDDSYLEAAQRALAPFSVDVADGGVVTDGGRWLEEYPDGTRVLNGAIFGLFGLWDLARTGNGEARTMFDMAAGYLAEHLPDYESHGAILYEQLEGRFSHPVYYRLQNKQIHALWVITGDRRFREVHRRWTRSLKAYPAPVFINMKTGAGSRIVTGEVDLVFKVYYPGAEVTVRRVERDGRASSVLARLPLYFTTYQRASFSWTAPTSPSPVRYRFDC